MGQAMATYSGQNYGCGKSERISEGVRAAIIIEVIYSIIAAILCLLLLRPVMALFFSGAGSVEEMMPWASTYIHLATLFYIPLSFIFIFRNAMQGCGHGFLPMMGGVVELFARLIVALLAMKLVLFPLAVFSDPAAWISACLFTAGAYLVVIRKVRKELSAAS